MDRSTFVERPGVDVDRPAERFAALGHPFRFRILAMLAERPASSGEVARRLARPAGTVAYHVGVLERAGLVQVISTRRVRALTERIYGPTALADDVVGAVRPPSSGPAQPTASTGRATPHAPGLARPMVELPASSQAGVLRFIRYGFMPNRLGYCGPDENRRLFEHGVAGEADASLVPNLARFLGPMPYLRAIAAGSGIRDVFDDRVVEAYWIGNDLLETFASRELYEALRERFRRELPPKVMDLIAEKIPAGALPHHSFHVFDVWLRVGKLDGNVLATIDHCRISWGTVTSVDGATVGVDQPPLVIERGKLKVGPTQHVFATRLVDGKGFVTELAAGDLVALHWGWVCERLSAGQARDLERFTRHHLRIANQTL